MSLPINVCLSVAFFLGTSRRACPEVIVGADCCNIVNRGHCWNAFVQLEQRPLLVYIVASGNLGLCWSALLQQCEPRSLLEHIVTVPWDTTVAFDTIVAFDCHADVDALCGA
jgi:hypothetical protein